VNRSARHQQGAKKREVADTRKRDEGKDRASEVMTAMRLALTLWELISAIVREHMSGGGPGRVL
jgi:hypothetical protein